MYGSVAEGGGREAASRLWLVRVSVRFRVGVRVESQACMYCTIG